MARGHQLRHMTPETPIAALPTARRLLIERDGLTCPDCGVQMWDPDDAYDRRTGAPTHDLLDAKTCATVDHLTPRVAGGRNVWGNYQLCCRSCNSKRFATWRTANPHLPHVRQPAAARAAQRRAQVAATRALAHRMVTEAYQKANAR